MSKEKSENAQHIYSAKEAKKLYKNVEFYKIVDGKEVGPLDNIRYLYPVGFDSEKAPTVYFCEIEDGVIVNLLTEDEVVVKHI